MIAALPADVKQRLPIVVPNCIECGSTNLVQNIDGYTVCAACGLVSDETPFVVSDPLARGGGFVQAHAIQARYHGTIVGSKPEHKQADPALQRAVRVSGPSYYIHVLEAGYFAIKRVMCQAGLEGHGALFDGANKLFRQFYDHFPHASQARNVDVLAIVAVYRTVEGAVPCVTFRQLLEKSLPGPQHRAAAFEALQRSAPLSVPPDLLKRLLCHVQKLAGDLNLSPALEFSAGHFTRANSRAFPASKASITAAALLEVACLCAGADVPVTHVASAAGVAPSAVFRCLRRVAAARGIMVPGTIRWADLRTHLRDLFGDKANTLPIPAILQEIKVPAGASTAAGFIAGEVEASPLAPEIRAVPMQAAIVISGIAGQSRPSTPRQMAGIVYKVTSSLKIPARPVIQCLLKIHSLSRVLPSFLGEEVLVGLVPAPLLVPRGADGPPGVVSFAPGDPPSDG